MKTDNLILIKGGAYNDIKKALRQWIDHYSKDLEDGLTFQLYKNGSGNHIIQADTRLDNERFYYLVNYLKYPEGIEYKIHIEGFTTGKDNNQLKDKELLVYISQSDKAFDNVFVTTSENENFKVDFGGKITENRERRIYKQPNDIQFNNPDVLIVRKELFLKKELDTNNSDSIDKRFKIISLIAVILFISTFLTYSITQDVVLFHKLTFYFGMGIWLWFFSDFEMLERLYIYRWCFIISILYGTYAIFLNNYYGDLDSIDLYFGALHPLSLLIIQKPLSHLYKTIFHREPKVDKHGKFADLVYTLILFLSSLLTPILIYGHLNA